MPTKLLEDIPFPDGIIGECSICLFRVLDDQGLTR
jgi:hypothetical protein